VFNLGMSVMSLLFRAKCYIGFVNNQYVFQCLNGPQSRIALIGLNVASKSYPHLSFEEVHSV
jgi:hypothetical protein